ncbi:MAG: HlyD family secretion protein [Janthinobacterium lividum]
MSAALKKTTSATADRNVAGAPRLTRARIVGSAIVLLLVVAAAGWLLRWYQVGRFIESTDDAFLSSDAVTVAPNVAGYVTVVMVTDNQHVKTGQLIARIDDRDYQAVRAQATASVQEAEAGMHAADAQILQQRAAIEQAQADLDRDQAQLHLAVLERSRAADLSRTGAGTIQGADRTDSMLRQNVAILRHDQAALDAAQTHTQALQAGRAYAVAGIAKAQADLARADLNVGYTSIRAPIDGIVGDRSLRLGNFVQPGLNLLTLVPVGQALYVLANFKETQLGRMIEGQPVSFTVDAFGGHVFHGHVESFSPGTGSQFALLPPENATGNYTKIVQRVPVRIRLDSADPLLGRLRAGLSADVSVDTRVASDNNTRVASANNTRVASDDSTRVAGDTDMRDMFKNDIPNGSHR